MKICEKCGAYNADERRFCVDCSEMLGDPLSAQEQEAVENAISDSVEQLYTRTDPLVVSRFDKIFGWLCVAGCAALLALIVVEQVTPWTNDIPETYLYGFLFCIAGAVDAFVPHLAWALEKLRVRRYVNVGDDITPSDYYFVSRRAGLVLCAALGILCVILAAYGLFCAKEPGFPPGVVVRHPEEGEVLYNCVRLGGLR